MAAFALLQAEAETITFQRDGIVWTVPVADLVVGARLFGTGGFQREELRSLVHWLSATGYLPSERQVVIEVGANIGTTTVLLARETEVHVIAIEPVPANFGLLHKNVTENGLAGRVTCIPAAISETAAELTMLVDKRNSGAAEVADNQGHGTMFSASEMVTVPARTLSDVLACEGIAPEQVAFVWSDTQGYEQQVIDSGRNLWALGVPLFAEVSPEVLALHGGTASFVSSACRHFTHMLLRDDLVRDGVLAIPRPITELGRAVARLSGSAYTDVLLIPQSPMRRDDRR